jgi:pilus assembly protein CpaF
LLLLTNASADSTHRDVLEAALRLRPDRIVVGELHGTPAYEALAAGIETNGGLLTTVHANSAREALRRIELFGAQAASAPAARARVAETLDIVVYLTRDGSDRRVQEIVQVLPLDDGGYRAITLYERGRDGHLGKDDWLVRHHAPIVTEPWATRSWELEGDGDE